MNSIGKHKLLVFPDISASPQRTITNISLSTPIEYSLFLPGKKKPRNICSRALTHLSKEALLLTLFSLLLIFFFLGFLLLELFKQGTTLATFPFLFYFFATFFFSHYTASNALYSQDINHFPTAFSMDRRSTSKTSTELGSIIGGTPCSP